MYLNEQKVASLTNAAVLADEFILTHKSVFSMSTTCSLSVMPERKVKSPRPMCKPAPPATGESQECFYCHEPGHLIAVCPALKRKGQLKMANILAAWVS